MKKGSRYCVLIPCSVNVWARRTALIDTAKRREEYIRSVIFWISQPHVKDIVICENTGSYFLPDFIREVAEALSKNIEFLVFQGNKSLIASKGKGYGEGEILKYAIDHSKLIKRHKAFFKVTGKLNILNFRSIVSSHKFNENNNYFLLSAPKVFRRIHKIDTRFFYVQVSFFKEVLWNIHEIIDEENGINLERAFYQRLKNYRNQIFPFPVVPIIEGMSGSTGKVYSFSPIRYCLKNVLNKIGLYKL